MKGGSELGRSPKEVASQYSQVDNSFQFHFH